MSAFQFARTHPYVSAFAVGGAGAFGTGAYFRAKEDRQEEPDLTLSERTASAVTAGGQAVGMFAATVGLGAAAWSGRKPLMAVGGKIGGWLKRDAFDTSEAIRKGLMARGETRMYAALHGYGSSGTLMVGGGAALGTAIGAYMGHPWLGMAVGATAGAAVKAGLGASRFWRQMGKIPGGKTLATVGLSVALYHVTQAVRGPQPAETTYGVRDDIGGYDYSAEAPPPRSGVKERMNRMGATGDLAFGLHSRR